MWMPDVDVDDCGCGYSYTVTDVRLFFVLIKVDIYCHSIKWGEGVFSFIKTVYGIVYGP